MEETGKWCRKGDERQKKRASWGTDNQITCTHRINYQSGRDCATLTEGKRRGKLNRERKLVVLVRVVTRRRSNRAERKIVREKRRVE